MKRPACYQRAESREPCRQVFTSEVLQEEIEVNDTMTNFKIQKITLIAIVVSWVSSFFRIRYLTGAVLRKRLHTEKLDEALVYAVHQVFKTDTALITPVEILLEAPCCNGRNLRASAYDNLPKNLPLNGALILPS